MDPSYGPLFDPAGAIFSMGACLWQIDPRFAAHSKGTWFPKNEMTSPWCWKASALHEA